MRPLSQAGGPRVQPGRSPLTFFFLVFALAIPFWVFGAMTGLQLLPGLPVAALMFVCPAIAALILAHRENGVAGAKALLKRAYDCKRIRAKVWYAPILLLYPCVMVLSYGVMQFAGTPVPAPPIVALTALLLCAGFFVGALGEELGWSGYVIDPLQNRWSALQASLVLGLIWAVFHFIALAEAHRSVAWIAWWSLGTVAARVIIVWLYNNTGGSVFATALFHTTLNVGWQLFPIDGSYFDPRITGSITAFVAAIIIVLWGPRTLARYRIPSGSGRTTSASYQLGE